MENVLAHPAAPVEDVVTHGGYAEIARRLNALHPERPKPISRQLVERWFKCRGFNQFPEPGPVEVNGRVRVLFLLGAVEQWYVDRERERVEAGNPPIETIPMFQVDRRGQPMISRPHPIDAEQSSYRGHPSASQESSRGQESLLDL